MVCTLKKMDPVLKIMLDYGINPLRFARKESPLGLIYVVGKPQDGQPTQQIWDAEDALTAALATLSPKEITTDRAQRLSAKRTDTLDLTAGLKVVARVCPTLDEAGAAKLAASMAQSGVSGISFRIDAPRCQRLPVSKLQTLLAEAELSAALERVLVDEQVFLVTGAWSATQLQVQGLTKTRMGLDLAASLKALATGSLSLKQADAGRSEIAFVSKTPLFWGVELMRVDRHLDGGLRLAAYRPDEMLLNDADGPYERGLADIWTGGYEDAELILPI